MNDENLENYLYTQFNDVLDSHDDVMKKQEQLGKLFLSAANSITSIYLINHQKEAKEMFAMMTGKDLEVDFRNILKNEWYIYTNIEIWLDFAHSVFKEIQPTHPQHDFFMQVMDSITNIEQELGIQQNTMVS